MVAVQMPAVCRSCQRPFPSGLAADNAQRLSLTGGTSGPCPYCGAPVGDIPDGVYDFVDSTITLLERLPTSRDELLAAAGIMQRHLATGDVDVNAIEREVADAAPNAVGLVQLLRDPAMANVLAIMALIVSIIFGILGSQPDQTTVRVEQDQVRPVEEPAVDPTEPAGSPVRETQPPAPPAADSPSPP